MHLLDLLKQLQAAVSPHPPKGASVRTIALHLESLATSREQKEIIRRLKDAGPNGDLQVIANSVRSVFLRGVIGNDGWPQK